MELSNQTHPITIHNAFPTLLHVMTIKSAITLSGIVTFVYALLGVLFLEYYQEVDFLPSGLLEFFVAPIVIIVFGAKSTGMAIGLFAASFVAIWMVLFLLLLIIRLFKKLALQ